MAATTPALSDPGTAAALRRYRLRSLGLAGSGLLGAAVGAAVLELAGYPEDGPVSTIVVLVLGASVVPLVGGLLALANSVRMRAALARHPWREWPARYAQVGGAATPNGQPTLLLGDGDGDGVGVGEHVLTLVAFNWRWTPFAGVDRVRLAGPPTRGGVVSPTGRDHLVWARRPLSGAWRRHLVRGARAQAE
jgi:hypothetical protein